MCHYPRARHARHLILLCVLSGMSSSLCARSLPAADTLSAASVPEKERVFHARQLIAPASLITVGALGVSIPAFCKAKEHIRDGFQNWSDGRKCHVDDYIQYLPAVANLGLGLTGVKARHPFRERVAVTATAYVAMAAMTNATKYLVKERRPDSDSRNSFPSGHTATAFTGAELMREEYGNLIGLGAYTVASGVAVLRLYNDRHWANDLLAGAGIGILSARIGYWLLPFERRLFRWDRKKASVVALPTYAPETRTVGLAFSAQL